MGQESGEVIKVKPGHSKQWGQQWGEQSGAGGFPGCAARPQPCLTSCSCQVETDRFLHPDGRWRGEQALGSSLSSLGIPLMGHADSYPCGTFSMNIFKPMMC